MNKYTIKNIFERHFSFPVWKIEVDCTRKHLAVEYRHPDTTLAHFEVFDFEGNEKSISIQADEKEWTLDSIQGDFLILKRFGSSSPIEAGIQILHYPTGQVVCDYREYVLVDVYEHLVVAKHRSIPGGLLYHIDIQTGEVHIAPQDQSPKLPFVNIKYPIAYEGRKPSFIESIPYVEHIWLLPFEDHFIWAYHLKDKDNYDLHLQISTREQSIDHQIILKNLDRLIPQPFFAVQGHIFFLSNCKLKIKGYLV